MQLRQRLRRLEARRAAAPVGARGAGYGVRYLPTDPETLTEIVTIRAQAQALPGPEGDDEAGIAAVVALVVGLHDVLGEEGCRRYALPRRATTVGRSPGRAGGAAGAAR